MKQFTLTIALSSLITVSSLAQSENINLLIFLQGDSSYTLVDNNKGNWYTLNFKADTLTKDINDNIIYNNRKVLQINVIPFAEILTKQKKSIPLTKALKAYKKWELNYQKEVIGTKLKSGEEIYYRDHKPFLIWWHKNPPPDDEDDEGVIEEIYNSETGTFEKPKTLYVTHMLCLNFSIYGSKNVAFTIPVFEDEDLENEIEYLKDVANSLRVYGGNVDIDVLMEKENSENNYIFRDSLNLVELEVPNWLNVISPARNNMFGATFPEYHEVVNAMVLRWDYKDDSLTFEDYIKQGKIPNTSKPGYRLIEKNDSTYKYFNTSENGWFHQQCVYLNGDQTYAFIVFTATKDTYEYNIERFEEILDRLILK